MKSRWKGSFAVPPEPFQHGADVRGKDIASAAFMGELQQIIDLGEDEIRAVFSSSVAKRIEGESESACGWPLGACVNSDRT
jgi:hypothetical protein